MSDYRLVYVDYRPDGIPFYVGLGTAVRVGQTRRNKQHSEVTKRYPTWYRTLAFGGSLKECKKKEIELIAQFGRSDLKKGTLTNLTDGGSGSIVYESTKEKQRLSSAKRSKDSWSHMRGEHNPAKKEENRAKRTKLNIIDPPALKRSKDSWDWMRGDKHFMARKVRCIETGREFNTTVKAAEWVKNLGNPKCGHTGISKVLAGRAKTFYGYHWEYVC